MRHRQTFQILSTAILTFYALFSFAQISYGIPTRQEVNAFFVTTIAGDGTGGFLDGKITAARFNWPTGVAVDEKGDVFIADYKNNAIRKIDASSNVSTVAGRGKAGHKDGKGGEALLWGPDTIVIDKKENIFVADADNFRIRKISADGIVSTVAGSGIMGLMDGVGAHTMFGYPTGIAIADDGTLYVADRRAHAVRKITPDGAVTTIAGNGMPGYVDGAAALSRLKEPMTVAVGREGVIYVADSGNDAIRKITKDSIVSTLVGGKMAGYRNGVGKEAMFSWPTGIALDMNDNIYVADSNNNKIRKVTPTGVVSTIAGGLVAGSQNGPAMLSSFNFPTGITVDRFGNIYVADSGNNMIRKITYGASSTSLDGTSFPTFKAFASKLVLGAQKDTFLKQDSWQR